MPVDQEPACSLLAVILAEGERGYGPSEGARRPAPRPADMASRHGAFLVVYEDGRPLACGGLKRLDDHTAEIKRMYVVAQAAVEALAGSLLGALEEEAWRLGTKARQGPSPVPGSI